MERSTRRAPARRRLCASKATPAAIDVRHVRVRTSPRARKHRNMIRALIALMAMTALGCGTESTAATDSASPPTDADATDVLGDTAASDDSYSAPDTGEEAPLCLVDCFGTRWFCTDSTHATAAERHDCHYRCGEAPCTGCSDDPTGPVTECPPGTECYPDGILADGGQPDGPCQAP